MTQSGVCQQSEATCITGGLLQFQLLRALKQASVSYQVGQRAIIAALRIFGEETTRDFAPVLVIGDALATVTVFITRGVGTGTMVSGFFRDTGHFNPLR